MMTGKQLFDKYLAIGDEYTSLLLTISMSLGDDLYPLLETAEKQGKKLAVKDQDDFVDDILIKDILFV